jgi:peptidyl-prolyl cis-trans isomerase C
MTRFRSAACLTIIAALTASPLMAQEDKTVARVNGIAITEQDLVIATEDLGERLPATLQDAQKRDYLIGYLVDLKIGAKAAEDAKMDKAPDFARRLSYFREKVLLDELLSQESKKSITPEAARKLYDETLKGLTPEEEVRARHILVEDEGEVKKIHARVKAGEDFAKIAGEVSKDPGSGKEGGELGFFTKDRMVQPFAEAAFKLKPNEISEPVKSQFGWHIIKLEERRMKPLPSFDEVKGQIESYLGRKAQQDVVLSLRDKAKIERLDKPAEPAKPADAAKPAEPKKN